MKTNSLLVIAVLTLVSCNTNLNYDKSMLPDAEPKVLSEVSSKVLISCMQIPVPRPPVPINPNFIILRLLLSQKLKYWCGAKNYT